MQLSWRSLLWEPAANEDRLNLAGLLNVLDGEWIARQLASCSYCYDWVMDRPRGGLPACFCVVYTCDHTCVKWSRGIWQWPRHTV